MESAPGLVSALTYRLEVISRLSPDERAAIEALGRNHREVPPRRDVIREGECPHAVQLVLGGWGCRYKALPDGRRQIVGFIIPGDLCDLNVYILRQMDHSIGAITRMRIAEITREDMDTLAAEHPRATEALWREQLVTESIQREWTLNIGQRNAHERIAHLLVETFIRLQTAGLTDQERCDLPLTQSDLADACGLTAIHVNRTLQELRREGLIELEQKRLRIPDLGGLMEVAMFNPKYLHLDDDGHRAGFSG